MEFTTHLELQSQTTRLVESRNDANIQSGMYGAVTLTGAPFQKTLPDLLAPIMPLQTTFPKILRLSFSRFTRRY
jgi:hypothetical protein